MWFVNWLLEKLFGLFRANRDKKIEDIHNIADSLLEMGEKYRYSIDNPDNEFLFSEKRDGSEGDILPRDSHSTNENLMDVNLLVAKTLFLAACNGRLEVVDFLLNSDKFKNAIEDDCNAALYAAYLSEHMDVCRRFLDVPKVRNAVFSDKSLLAISLTRSVLKNSNFSFSQGGGSLSSTENTDESLEKEAKNEILNAKDSMMVENKVLQFSDPTESSCDGVLLHSKQGVASDESKQADSPPRKRHKS